MKRPSRSQERPTRSSGKTRPPGAPARGTKASHGGPHGTKAHAPSARDEAGAASRPASFAPARGGSYWLYGRHAVEAALANPARRVKRLQATGGALEHFSTLPKTLEVQRVESAALQKLLGPEAVHQGLALEVMPLEEPALEDILAATRPDSVLLILDQVTDPHNIGAILRSAAAFDTVAIVLARDHTPGETATMAKSACGALELVPRVPVTNLARAMEEIKQAGYWIVGLDGAATQALHEHKLSGRVALVLGAEGKGMRRLTLEHCDLLARLPISPRMESLNVSNAAAIALYELARAPKV